MTLIKIILFSLVLLSPTFAYDYEFGIVETSTNTAEIQVKAIQGMTLVAVHYSVNKSVPNVSVGTCNFDIRSQSNGIFSQKIPSGTNCEGVSGLKSGDVINYWVLAIINGGGYQNLNLSYTFKGVPPKYTISPSAGLNGTISPNQPFDVEKGKSANFTFQPNAGYQVSKVITNGVTHNTHNTTWTINNITSNQSIKVEFEPLPYHTVTPSSGPNGTITPDQPFTVNNGERADFTFTPDPFYKIKRIVINGETKYIAHNVWTISNITTDQNISVEFEPDPALHHKVTVIQSPNGTITPAGATTVREGSDFTLNFTPEVGYELYEIYVNQMYADNKSPFTVKNITADKEIRGFFRQKEYTINASVSSNGTATATPSKVKHGASSTVTFDIDIDYLLEYIEINGVRQATTSNTLSLSNITENKTIIAYTKFDATPKHTMTATAGPNGTISPNNTTIVKEGQDLTYTITADPGYEIETLTVNGNIIPSRSSYTFSDIKGDSTIDVTFRLKPTVPTSELLSITGNLTDATGSPVTTTVDMSVTLHTHPVANSEVYYEEFFNTDAISVVDGAFVINLGSGSSSYDLKTVVTSNTSIYVEITVGSGVTADKMAPRMPLTSAGFSFH